MNTTAATGTTARAFHEYAKRGNPITPVVGAIVGAVCRMSFRFNSSVTDGTMLILYPYASCDHRLCDQPHPRGLLRLLHVFRFAVLPEADQVARH